MIKILFFQGKEGLKESGGVKCCVGIRSYPIRYNKYIRYGTLLM